MPSSKQLAQYEKALGAIRTRESGEIAVANNAIGAYARRSNKGRKRFEAAAKAIELKKAQEENAKQAGIFGTGIGPHVSFGKVMHALDTPASYARSALYGQLAPELADQLGIGKGHDFSLSELHKDAQKHYGYTDYIDKLDDNKVNKSVDIGPAGALAGFAIDTVTDPLIFVGPAKAAEGGAQAVARRILGEGSERVAVKLAAERGIDVADEIAMKALREEGTRVAEDAAARVAKGGTAALGREESKVLLGTTRGAKVTIPGTGRILGKGREAKQLTILPQEVTDALTLPFRGARQAVRGSEAGRLLSKVSGSRGTILREALISGDNARIVRTIKFLDDTNVGRAIGEALGHNFAEEYTRDIRKLIKGHEKDVIRVIEEGGDLASVKGAQEMKDFLGRMYTAATERGIPLEEVDNYFPRIISDEARAARAKIAARPAEAGGYNPEKLRDPTGFEATTGVPKGADNWRIRTGANEYAQRELNFRGDFFESHPDKVIGAYISGLVQKVGKQETLKRLMAEGIVQDADAAARAIWLAEQANLEQDLGRRADLLARSQALLDEARTAAQANAEMVDQLTPQGGTLLNGGRPEGDVMGAFPMGPASAEAEAAAAADPLAGRVPQPEAGDVPGLNVGAEGEYRTGVPAMSQDEFIADYQARQAAKQAQDEADYQAFQADVERRRATRHEQAARIEAEVDGEIASREGAIRFRQDNGERKWYVEGHEDQGYHSTKAKAKEWQEGGGKGSKTFARRRAEAKSLRGDHREYATMLADAARRDARASVKLTKAVRREVQNVGVDEALRMGMIGEQEVLDMTRKQLIDHYEQILKRTEREQLGLVPRQGEVIPPVRQPYNAGTVVDSLPEGNPGAARDLRPDQLAIERVRGFDEGTERGLPTVGGMEPLPGAENKFGSMDEGISDYQRARSENTAVPMRNAQDPNGDPIWRQLEDDGAGLGVDRTPKTDAEWAVLRRREMEHNLFLANAGQGAEDLGDGWVLLGENTTAQPSTVSGYQGGHLRASATEHGMSGVGPELTPTEAVSAKLRRILGAREDADTTIISHLIDAGADPKTIDAIREGRVIQNAQLKQVFEAMDGDPAELTQFLNDHYGTRGGGQINLDKLREVVGKAERETSATNRWWNGKEWVTDEGVLPEGRLEDLRRTRTEMAQPRNTRHGSANVEGAADNLGAQTKVGPTDDEKVLRNIQRDAEDLAAVTGRKAEDFVTVEPYSAPRSAAGDVAQGIDSDNLVIRWVGEVDGVPKYRVYDQTAGEYFGPKGGVAENVANAERRAIIETRRAELRSNPIAGSARKVGTRVKIHWDRIDEAVADLAQRDALAADRPDLAAGLKSPAQAADARVMEQINADFMTSAPDPQSALRESLLEERRLFDQMRGGVKRELPKQPLALERGVDPQIEEILAQAQTYDDMVESVRSAVLYQGGDEAAAQRLIKKIDPTLKQLAWERQRGAILENARNAQSALDLQVSMLEARVAKAESLLAATRGKAQWAELGIDKAPTAAELAPHLDEMTKQLHEQGYAFIAGSEGLMAPQDIADMMAPLAKATPSELRQGVLKVYDSLLNYIKAWQIATPGFHVRNFMGGVFNNFLADIDPGSYRRFLAARKADTEGLEVGTRVWGHRVTAEDLDAYRQTKEILSRGQYSQVEVNTGLNHEGLSHQWNPFSPMFAPLHLSQRAGGGVEEILRGSLAMDRFRKGAGAAEALSDVYKFHFDYNDISSFEKDVVKRVIPFYTWTRKNFPLQLEMMVTRPGKYSWYNHLQQNFAAANTDQQQGLPIPGYFSELGAIPLGFNVGGGQGYATPDLPFTRSMREMLPIQDGKPSLDPLMTQVTPLVKVPLERIKNKQFFKGIPFKDEKVEAPASWTRVPGLHEALQALGVVDKKGMTTDRDAYTVESLMPLLGRFRRLQPNEKKYQERALTSWLSFLGVPLRTNTKYEQEMEQARRAWLRNQEK